MIESRVLGEAQYRSLDDQPRTQLHGQKDIDDLVNALLAEERDCRMAQIVSFERPLLPSGIVDHLLDVGVCRERQVGVIGFTDVTGNYATWNPAGGSMETRYFLEGDPRDFPAYSEFPLDTIRQAVKEFLLT